MPEQSRRTLLRTGALALTATAPGCSDSLGGLSAGSPTTRDATDGSNAPAGIPDVLDQSLPNPEQFVADEHADLARTNGTVAVDSETGVLRFGSDGDGETVTAVGGYLAADALLAQETWTGTVDADAKRIGTSVADAVDALAFTPESFAGVALRATETVDLYVDGVLVMAGVTMIVYTTDRGVYRARTPESGGDGDGDGASEGSDWPTFQHDAANTGHNPGASPPTTEPSVDWSFVPPTAGQDPNGFTVPAIADDAVFVIDDAVGRVHALEAATDAQDRERWSYNLTESPFTGALTVANDTVYVGTGDGQIHALKSEGEESRWKRTLPGTEEDATPYFGEITVQDGTLYVGADGIAGGILYARDAATGDPEWEFDAGAPISRAPAVVDGTVFVGTNDGTLYAVADGEDQWSFDEWDPSTVGAAAVVDDTVYVGSTEEAVYALSVEDGSERWSRPFTVPMNGSPTVTDDGVYLMDTRYVYKVDPETGRRGEDDLYDTGSTLPMLYTPAFADGTLYFGDVAGTLYAVDADTLEERWTKTFDGEPVVYAAPADDRVYVGTSRRDGGERNGTVYALTDA